MMKNKKTFTHTLFLIFLSALLLVLSYPPFNFWPGALIALVPFFALIRRARGLGHAFLLGYMTGALFFFGLIFWLVHVIWIAPFFVVGIIADRKSVV